MKKVICLMLTCFISSFVVAQENKKSEMQKMQEEYEKYKKDAIDEYESYRDKMNQEFADFMKKEWEEFQSFKGKPLPKSPDPETPPVKKNPEEKPVDNPVPQGKVTPLPVPPKHQPKPIEPIPVPVEPVPENKPTLNFSFYGDPCSVPWDNSMTYKINSMDKNELADLWIKLSDKKYNAFLSDCIRLRTDLSLCDWAYLNFLQQLSAEIFGDSKSNEAIFMQMFVLSQIGYKVRLAQTDQNHLLLLVNTDCVLYEKPYLTIDNAMFYILDKNAASGQNIYVVNQEFPQEKSLSMYIGNEQFANKNETSPKTFKSVKYPVENIQTGVNKSLIDFYNNYPFCDWKMYAETPLSSTVKKNLYPVLMAAIKGKSKTEAADMLLNFVQTAFAYKTDEEQFGYERSFFPDEVFYYPYCDCEDRAILYSVIVRDLLGLKVVLLHYPDHLATAVRFDAEVSGDYVTVNGQKYLVCDPTYIGAPIGDAMPQFKHTQAEIVLLSNS